METTELTTDLQVGVSYTPSEITIQNEQHLASNVNKLVALYGSLTFTDDNIPEAKAAKSSLNKVKKILEDQRKDVKKKYNEPLKLFEDRIKSYVEKIDRVKDDIDAGIKDFDEREKQKRQKVLDAIIAEMAPNYEVSIKELEIDPTWINKSNFTTKGEVNRKTVDAIADKMGFISLEKRRIEDDKKTVDTFAKLNGLEPYAWENLIVQGHSVNDVLERMEAAAKQKVLDAEQKEKERLAQEEYDQAMAKLAQEQQETVGDKTVDTETGEVISDEPTPVDSDPIMTFTLRISGPKTKLVALNQYMIDEGISFEKVANN